MRGRRSKIRPGGEMEELRQPKDVLQVSGLQETRQEQKENREEEIMQFSEPES